MAVKSDWITRSLGDVATLQRGFDLPHRNRVQGAIPIVTSSGIEDFHNLWKAQGPGVITGRYGTIGEVFYVSSYYWPHNTTLYVKDFHGNVPRYIYYLLKTVDFASHSGKSGVPGVNRNDLHQEFVKIPPTLREQEAIAGFIGCGCMDRIARATDRQEASDQTRCHAGIAHRKTPTTRVQWGVGDEVTQ